MKKLLSIVFSLLVLSSGFTAFADDALEGSVEANVSNSTTDGEWYDMWEKGSFTEENPTASRVGLLPLRAVTAVIGAPVGAVTGMFKGAGDGFKGNYEATFANIPTDDTDPIAGAVSSTLKAPLLGTLGILGTVIATPVGAVIGIAEGAVHGTVKGYMYPDKI